MAYNLINCEKKRHLLTITLNRPKKLNSLSRELRQELQYCFGETAKDQDIKVMIITGNSECFCVGADIEEINSLKTVEDAYNFSREFHILFQQLQRLPFPTIAAIGGYALGGGCELVLSCDLRIAGKNAIIGVPEIDLGALPAGSGTQQLPRIIGMTSAKELLFTGEPVNADAAWRIGLVNKVVAKDMIMTEAENIAAKLASKSLPALRAIKLAVNIGTNVDLSSALEFEAKSFSSLFASNEFKEGVSAFINKKKVRKANNNCT